MNQQQRDNPDSVRIIPQQNSLPQMANIKKPQHNIKLANALNSLLECESLIDVTIYCDDGQINAHRLVLAASSTYFRNLFSRMPPTLQYPIVVLREVSVVDLKTIIQFIYYGEVDVPQSQVDSLMRCADYLQIDGMASSTNSLNAVLASTSSSSTNDVQKSTIQHSVNFYHSTNGVNSSNTSAGPRTLVELQNGSLKLRPHVSNTVSNSLNSNNNRRYSSFNPKRRNQRDYTDSNTLLGINQVGNLPFLNESSETMFFGTSDNHKVYNQASTSNEDEKASKRRSDEKIKYECLTCHKFFTHGFTLKRHMKLHSQRPLIYCDTCSKSYSCRDSFLRHKKSTGHISHSEYHRSMDVDINIEK